MLGLVRFRSCVGISVILRVKVTVSADISDPTQHVLTLRPFCGRALLCPFLPDYFHWGTGDTRDSLQGEKKQRYMWNSIPQQQFRTPQYLHRASRVTSPVSSTRLKARKAKAAGRHMEVEAEAPGTNKKRIQQQKQQFSSPRSAITSSLTTPVHFYPFCSASFFLTAVLLSLF